MTAVSAVTSAPRTGACCSVPDGAGTDRPQEEASSGLPGAGVAAGVPAGVPALLPRPGGPGRALRLLDQQTPRMPTVDLGGPEPKSRKAARGRPGLLGHMGFPPGGSWPSLGNSATCCGSVGPRSLLRAGTALGPGSAGSTRTAVPLGSSMHVTRDPTPWARPPLDPGPCSLRAPSLAQPPGLREGVTGAPHSDGAAGVGTGLTP